MKPWEEYAEDSGPWAEFAEPTQQEGTNPIKETLANLPRSAADYVGNLVQLGMHPIQAAQTLGRVASGGVQAAISSERPTEDRAAFDQFIQAQKERYGSLENIGRTMRQDPVGFAGDASSLLFAGGSALRGAGMLSKSQPLVAAGKMAQSAGAVTEPIGATMKLVGKAGSAIPTGVPRKLYESAAKFSTVLTEAERAKLTDTALKHGIPPTISGVIKVGDTISELNQKITGKIVDSTNQMKIQQAVGGAQSISPLPVDDLFNGLSELRKQALKTSGTPMDDIKAINRIEKQIREANAKLGRDELTPLEAQKLKQGIYKDIESYYTQFNNSPANVKAQKSIAKAAKEYIESVLPEIKQLNAEEGALIELRDAIQRSANRITNRDLLGIGAPIKANVGGVVGGPAGAIGGFMLGLLDTPAIKSKLAIAVENLRSKGIKISNTGALVRLGLINLGRGAEEGPSESRMVPIRQVGKITDQDLADLMPAE